MTRYLVQIRDEDGYVWSKLETDIEIIDRIGWTDCTNEDLRIYDISEFGKVEKLNIDYPGHDVRDMLKTVVRRENGEVVFCGHVEDH